MGRLNLDDGFNDILFKMSDGNPGAINVMMDAMDNAPSIDPDNMMGGMGFVLNMDSFGIYGPKIWRLFKDVCGENIAATIGVVRAVQCGILSVDKLLLAVEDGRNHSLNIQDILKQLIEKLPNFQIA